MWSTYLVSTSAVLMYVKSEFAFDSYCGASGWLLCSCNRNRRLCLGTDDVHLHRLCDDIHSCACGAGL